MRVSEFIEDFTIITAQQSKLPTPKIKTLGFVAAGIGLLLAVANLLPKLGVGYSLEQVVTILGILSILALIIYYTTYSYGETLTVSDKARQKAWDTLEKIANTKPQTRKQLQTIVDEVFSNEEVLKQDLRELLIDHTFKYLVESSVPEKPTSTILLQVDPTSADTLTYILRLQGNPQLPAKADELPIASPLLPSTEVQTQLEPTRSKLAQ